MEYFIDFCLITITITIFQAKKKMVKIIDGIIQSKRDCKSNSSAKDVADALLKDTSEELNDELIAENMIDLMIPGEDSVPVLVTLAIKFLSDCPAALTQLTVSKIDWISLLIKLSML